MATSQTLSRVRNFILLVYCAGALAATALAIEDDPELAPVRTQAARIPFHPDRAFYASTSDTSSPGFDALDNASGVNALLDK